MAYIHDQQCIGMQWYDTRQWGAWYNKRPEAQEHVAQDMDGWAVEVGHGDEEYDVADEVEKV
jgi:hypothetical protein